MEDRRSLRTSHNTLDCQSTALNHLHIQLYSPECTRAENIDINNNKQNKDRNILLNTVQLNIRYTFVYPFRLKLEGYF